MIKGEAPENVEAGKSRFANLHIKTSRSARMCTTQQQQQHILDSSQKK